MFKKNAPDPESADLSSKRSIDIRSREADRYVVDYFYHAGEFWTASIPFQVESIFGQAFNFSEVSTRKGKDGPEVVYDHRGQPKPKYSFINHLQSRFQLVPDQWIDLFPMNTDASGTPVHRVNDFVYSVEATGPPGTEFDFRNGFAGTLLCTHRFLSTQEMVFERVAVLGQYIWESPPLPITADEKREVLRKSLERSGASGLDEVYYLYRCCGTNNCTSNPFRIVDETVKYTWRQWLGSLVYRLPLNPRLYLRMRGLDADPSFYKLVRADFEEFIADPTTRQRKRDVVRAAIRQKRELRDQQAKRDGASG